MKLMTYFLTNSFADNSRSGDKSRDTTHVTLPLGPQSGPTSEAHAEVRPIVNIIVPNRREDLLPTEGQ